MVRLCKTMNLEKGDIMTKLLKYGLMALALVAFSIPALSFSADETFAAAEVQELIKLGINVNAKDATGMTPLDYAEKAQATNVVAVLKANGAQNGTSTEGLDWGGLYKKAQAAWEQIKGYVPQETLERVKGYLPEGSYEQYLTPSR